MSVECHGTQRNRQKKSNASTRLRNGALAKNVSCCLPHRHQTFRYFNETVSATRFDVTFVASHICKRKSNSNILPILHEFIPKRSALLMLKLKLKEKNIKKRKSSSSMNDQTLSTRLNRISSLCTQHNENPM